MTEHNADYYVAQPHRIEIFADEERTGVYAELPALQGCLAFATTREEALAILDDIKRVWIESALEDGWTIPEPIGAEAR